MTTITEDYVSFEVAKLLKEKGFDELCIFKYNYKGIRVKAGTAIDEWQNSELDDNECSCPTHQMAMRWLREIHKIIISVYPFDRDATSEEITSYTCDIATTKYSSKYGHLRGVWRTYEEVVEVAIKYCLEKLI